MARLRDDDELARGRQRLDESPHRFAGAELVATDPNPIDTAWTDRPSEPTHAVVPHDIAYSGESSSSKRARLGKMLADQKIEAAVITSPASIAWLFNIRGGDVSRDLQG